MAVLIFDRSVEATPEGLIVDPYCVLVGGVHGLLVVSPSGSVAGSPAFDQLIARLVERTLDQGCCAWTKAESEIDVQIKANKRERWYVIWCFL